MLKGMVDEQDGRVGHDRVATGQGLAGDNAFSFALDITDAEGKTVSITAEGDIVLLKQVANLLHKHDVVWGSDDSHAPPTGKAPVGVEAVDAHTLLASIPSILAHETVNNLGEILLAQDRTDEIRGHKTPPADIRVVECHLLMDEGADLASQEQRQPGRDKTQRMHRSWLILASTLTLDAGSVSVLIQGVVLTMGLALSIKA